MSWILVLIVTHSVTTIEFSSKELCETAAKELNKRSYSDATCFRRK